MKCFPFATVHFHGTGGMISEIGLHVSIFHFLLFSLFKQTYMHSVFLPFSLLQFSIMAFFTLPNRAFMCVAVFWKFRLDQYCVCFGLGSPIRFQKNVSVNIGY